MAPAFSHDTGHSRDEAVRNRTPLRMDYRVATRLVEHHDFAEGVRAAVIDKDQKPRWDPSRLNQVRDPDIARYFEPLGGGELTL